MPKYIDGFVLPIPKKNTRKYLKMAREGARVWKKFGALGYYECVGEDLTPKGDAQTKPRSFKDMAKAKSTDTVWFSFVVYKSRAHRDSVNKKVMEYYSKKYAKQKNPPMPFDMKKMAYGGFTVKVKS